MKKFTQIAGWAGLVFILLGLAVGFVQQKAGAVVMAHIIVGAVLLVLGILSNLSEIKEALMKRSARMGPQVVIQGVLILVILFFINSMTAKHDAIRDFTLYHVFTLTRATKDVMTHLPGDVEVIAFFPGNKPEEARQRLLLYEKSFPKVKLRFVDPDRQEEIARAEGARPEVGILFKYQENRVWINRFDENEITNAFIKAARDTHPRVWFTKGHGEPDLDSDGPSGIAILISMLEQQGYKPESIDLGTMDEIPQDIAMVAIVGPYSAFTKREIDMLDYYMGQGGNAVVFLDPSLERATLTGLEIFLAPLGVNARFNMIFDPESRLARDELGTSIVLTDLSDHPITAGLTQPRIVMPLARSLEKIEELSDLMEIQELARTSDGAYEKVINPMDYPASADKEEQSNYIMSIMNGKPGPGERTGSFVLAYAVKNSRTVYKWKETLGIDQTRETRLVAVGASSICRNQYISMPYNYEFVINAFNWLAGEKDLRNIRVTHRAGTRLSLNKNKKNAILYATIMILPELIMIVGLSVWWRRR